LSGEQREQWEAAREGRTGIAGFDAWAQELVATGYLHNHARMWFASIWIFTLRLPWELGAAFFYEHLLDGDVASNTLSWRWVAGLQTAGKTYLARADNIAHYTEGRHLPDTSRLATQPFPIVEQPLPKVAAWSESPVAEAGTSGRVGLWLHPEDLAVEQGSLAGLRFEAINASWPAGIAADVGWSPKVTQWTRATLKDGALRAAEHFGAEVVALETADLAQTLVDWARSRKLSAVVAYRPFVGPWQKEALVLESALAKVGIAIHWRRRSWDAEHFPHATRGYFPFWERIRSAG
jgi:deoxyribodipyrimidine photo-lyase